MAQRYTNATALVWMAQNLCPECGQRSAQHDSSANFWDHFGKCDLTPAGAQDRIEQYFADNPDGALRVKVTERLGSSSEAKIWRGETLVFHGVSYLDKIESVRGDEPYEILNGLKPAADTGDDCAVYARDVYDVMSKLVTQNERFATALGRRMTGEEISQALSYGIASGDITLPSDGEPVYWGADAWNLIHADIEVCVTHKRYAPCRREVGCLISSEPADVEMVRQYQQGDDDE